MKKKMLAKYLLRFIKKYHSNANFVFWPDLTSSHYSKNVINFLTSKDILTVKKEENPPNCPQLRPIENFWAIWKQKVYEGGWEAKNLNQLENRMKKKLKEIDQDVVQRMVMGVRTKIRKAKDNRINSVLT